MSGIISNTTPKIQLITKDKDDYYIWQEPLKKNKPDITLVAVDKEQDGLIDTLILKSNSERTRLELYYEDWKNNPHLSLKARLYGKISPLELFRDSSTLIRNYLTEVEKQKAEEEHLKQKLALEEKFKRAEKYLNLPLENGITGNLVSDLEINQLNMYGTTVDWIETTLVPNPDNPQSKIAGEWVPRFDLSATDNNCDGEVDVLSYRKWEPELRIGVLGFVNSEHRDLISLRDRMITKEYGKVEDNHHISTITLLAEGRLSALEHLKILQPNQNTEPKVPELETVTPEIYLQKAQQIFNSVVTSDHLNACEVNPYFQAIDRSQELIAYSTSQTLNQTQYTNFSLYVVQILNHLALKYPVAAELRNMFIENKIKLIPYHKNSDSQYPDVIESGFADSCVLGLTYNDKAYINISAITNLTGSAGVIFLIELLEVCIHEMIHINENHTSIPILMDPDLSLENIVLQLQEWQPTDLFKLTELEKSLYRLLLNELRCFIWVELFHKDLLGKFSSKMTNWIKMSHLDKSESFPDHITPEVVRHIFEEQVLFGYIMVHAKNFLNINPTDEDSRAYDSLHLKMLYAMHHFNTYEELAKEFNREPFTRLEKAD